MAGTYTTKNPSSCKICGQSFEYMKQLTNHVKKAHGLSAIDYTVQHIYSGVRPTCPVCARETRYVSLSFKKYCVEHSSHAEAEAGKIGGTSKQTWNKGATKETNTTLARLSKTYEGSGNPFHGKHHDPQTLETTAQKNRLPLEEVLRRLQTFAPNVTLLSSADEYACKQQSQLHVRCNTCGSESDVTLANIERCWMCRTCNPTGSRPQLEILEFIRDTLGFTDAVNNDRSTIAPFELDIWVPSRRVAIEYHGLYWHSGGKDPLAFDQKKHLEKFKLCRANGVRLIQFFSDEWETKRAICESMISNALGVVGKKLNARDCSLREITIAEAQKFFEENHLSGYTRASTKIALVHPKHGIVSAATLRKPIQKKWGDVLELARMASKTDVIVRGGASKMLSYLFEVVHKKGHEGLLSYADLRTGTGRVYDSCGFTLVGQTAQGYWYTNGKIREDRFKYRAQDGMTEAQYAELHKVRPVWGVGNAIYLKRF